jgi:hypothetical protein
MTVYSVPRRLRSVHTVAGAQGAAVAEYGEDAQVTFSGDLGVTIRVGVDGEPAGSCADGQPVLRGPAECVQDCAVGDATVVVQRGHPVYGRVRRARGRDARQREAAASRGRTGPCHGQRWRRRCSGRGNSGITAGSGALNVTTPDGSQPVLTERGQTEAQGREMT